MAVGVAAEVKNKLSVVDVVGETVQLKKAGSTFKGLCPFHGEKTPSFTVTPARESWKCFGCGEGGDIFSFVMKRDGLSFPEALKALAAKAGVEIDERTTREDARKARLRDVLESALSLAVNRSTYTPAAENVAVVTGLLALPNVTVPGPLSLLHVRVSVPGGFGNPSSVALPRIRPPSPTGPPFASRIGKITRSRKRS